MGIHSDPKWRLERPGYFRYIVFSFWAQKLPNEGGKVYVNSGAFKIFSKDYQLKEQQLAALMGHEIGKINQIIPIQDWSTIRTRIS
jgi:hypothetical protein